MNVALWIVQSLLALAFGAAGFMKLTAPIAEMAQNMSFVTYTPAILVRFIGAAELAGALGLILPSVLRIKPLLTPLAAVGLLIIMVLAAGTHAFQGEWASLPVNAVLGGLAAFVAWGRFNRVPLAPRAGAGEPAVSGSAA